MPCSDIAPPPRPILESRGCFNVLHNGEAIDVGMVGKYKQTGEDIIDRGNGVHGGLDSETLTTFINEGGSFPIPCTITHIWWDELWLSLSTHGHPHFVIIPLNCNALTFD